MSKSLPQQICQTQRLLIRRFSDEDLAPFILFLTDKDSTKFLTFSDKQKTSQGAESLLEMTIHSYDTSEAMLAFAVTEIVTGSFVGFCGLFPQDNETVEIMYAIVSQARRKGYATEVASILSRYALQELAYKRVIAPIAIDNEVSQMVARKAGFKYCGLIPSQDSKQLTRQFVFEK